MTAPSAAGAAAPARPEKTDAAHAWRIIISSSIGNALEMYDFTVYSFFALMIGKLFFPSDSAYGSLLLAVARSRRRSSVRQRRRRNSTQHRRHSPRLRSRRSRGPLLSPTRRTTRSS